jgi:hypothetical protein
MHKCYSIGYTTSSFSRKRSKKHKCLNPGEADPRSIHQIVLHKAKSVVQHSRRLVSPKFGAADPGGLGACPQKANRDPINQKMCVPGNGLILDLFVQLGLVRYR